MCRNEFIEELNRKGYSYEIVGDSIVVTHQSCVILSAKTIPKGVVFANALWVSLNYLTVLPEGTVFQNEGSVSMESLRTIPEGVVFQNKGSIMLQSVTTISQGVVVNNSGCLYLHSLTDLAEKTVFQNKGWVHMDSLSYIPKSVVFQNEGPVSLKSLTHLPEGTEFKNKGWVYMSKLPEIPEGAGFNNEGPVYLHSVTELPEGTVFNNEGMVYLPSSIGRHFYLGEKRLFETVDGLTMLIEHQKVTNGYTIKTARYFGGGPIEELDKCYIAEKDGESAHGSTVREAIEDLKFKLIKRTGTKELVEDIKGSGRVTLAQFRHITGACREGTRQHLAGLGIVLDDITDMALDEALAAMEGTSFGETFKKTLTGA